MAGLAKPPLTDKDYARINELLARGNQAQQEIDRAMQAGFPCDEMDTECKARVAMLKQIKATYFPERP